MELFDEDRKIEIPGGAQAYPPEMLFNRAELLLGPGVMSRLARTRVIIFGIGGVGSWTAEALARTGVGHITLVDADRVAVTNINRQAEASVQTVGEPKVEAMRRMLKAYNPLLDVEVVQREYNEETAGEFELDKFDYIIDAIDSLSAKALLILNATRSHARLLSSMGAALKCDPTRISVAEFWKINGCPLAAALRHKFRKNGIKPRRKFKCVYSPELLQNLGPSARPGADTSMSFHKVAVNGSLCHITAIFGMTLAGLLIDDIRRFDL